MSAKTRTDTTTTVARMINQDDDKQQQTVARKMMMMGKKKLCGLDDVDTHLPIAYVWPFKTYSSSSQMIYQAHYFFVFFCFFTPNVITCSALSLARDKLLKSVRASLGFNIGLMSI